jgi:ABC-type sugar transport system ATPase subunit
MYVFLDEITQRHEGAGTPVLDRVSLYARSGEILSVVGPAGAGKSTLLQFVGERSDGDGGVFMGTDDAREPGGTKPGLVRGWRFGSPGDAFPPRWRTEEWRGISVRRYAFPNIALDGSDREPAGEWSEDADNVHFSVESEDGTVRRVGWKGAAPNQESLPDLLLVDDLCGNAAFTEAEARRGFVHDLHRLHPRPEHRTMVYATRDGDDALAVADRIAVLDRGRIVQAGTPADVRDRPANELVAQLFGQPAINLVPAILEKDGQAILVGNQTVSLAGRIAEEFCRDITVGIRPPHAQLHREGAGWRGRVVSSAPYGEQSLVTVATEGVRVRALADEPFDADQRVVVRILPKHFIVFDDRGVRLDQL